HGFIYAIQRGLMVTGYDQLELGREVEEIFAHESRGYGVTTRQHFDLGFRPSPALLRLRGGHQPTADQSGELGRVPVVFRSHQSLDRDSSMVFVENANHGVEQDALAVAARSVKEVQRLVPCYAGEGGAKHPLQEGLKRLIAVRYLAQKREPHRA